MKLMTRFGCFHQNRWAYSHWKRRGRGCRETFVELESFIRHKIQICRDQECSWWKSNKIWNFNGFYVDCYRHENSGMSMSPVNTHAHTSTHKPSQVSVSTNAIAPKPQFEPRAFSFDIWLVPAWNTEISANRLVTIRNCREKKLSTQHFDGMAIQAECIRAFDKARTKNRPQFIRSKQNRMKQSKMKWKKANKKRKIEKKK